MDAGLTAGAFLVGGFIAAAIALGVLRALGRPPWEVGAAIGLAWLGVAISAAIGVAGLVAGSLEAAIVVGLDFSLVIGAPLSKLVLARRGRAEGKEFGEEKRGGGERAKDDGCLPQLFPAGQTPWNWSKSGESGTFGWYFWVANWYEWTMSIDMSADNTTAKGTAISKGRFSGWNSLSFTNHEAKSELTGHVWCDPGCTANASGDDDEETDQDWSSAAIVAASSQGENATLKVTCAVAFKGQVAVQQLTVSGSGSGVTVGATINMPTTSNHKKKHAKSYTYKCLPVEGEGAAAVTGG